MTQRFDYRIVPHPHHDPHQFGTAHRAGVMAKFLESIKDAGRDGWHVVGDIEIVGEKAVIMEREIPEPTEKNTLDLKVTPEKVEALTKIKTYLDATSRPAHTVIYKADSLDD
jgi:UDP-N-acetylmuramyl pentapeptide synthase